MSNETDRDIDKFYTTGDDVWEWCPDNQPTFPKTSIGDYQAMWQFLTYPKNYIGNRYNCKALSYSEVLSEFIRLFGNKSIKLDNEEQISSYNNTNFSNGGGLSSTMMYLIIAAVIVIIIAVVVYIYSETSLFGDTSKSSFK